MPKQVTRPKQRKYIVWVWGDSKRGIAIERSLRKSKGKYWWDILHVKDRKVVMVHRDYPSKAEATREAKSYAKYEKAHPGKGFLSIG